MSVIPTTAAERKGMPIFSGVIRYFPDALVAVSELSRIGNDQHNPGKPLHWDRTKSTDELDALTRHLWDAGGFDVDRVRHSTKIAWRALANLQKEIEAAGGVTLGPLLLPRSFQVNSLGEPLLPTEKNAGVLVPLMQVNSL